MLSEAAPSTRLGKYLRVDLVDPSIALRSAMTIIVFRHSRHGWRYSGTVRGSVISTGRNYSVCVVFVRSLGKIPYMS